MAKKPDEKNLGENPTFEVSETADCSAPDFLKPRSGSPAEPEWHMRDLERPLDAETNSLAEVTLEDEPQTAPAGVEPAASPTPPAPATPEPVDLTPEIKAASVKPNLPSRSPDKLQFSPKRRPENMQTKEPAPPKKGTKPPLVPPLEETAFERDLRLHKPALPEEKNAATGEDADPTKFAGPTGQVLSDGRTLRFPEGARFTSGDIVVCHDRRYRVKIQRRHPALVYGMPAGLLVLVLLAAIGVSSFFSGPPTGTITGVVVDAVTGKIIVGADVALRNGMTTRTNMAGMYVFAGLVPGSYEIKAQMPGYTGAAQTISRTGSQDAGLSFALQPLFASIVQEKPVVVETSVDKGENKEKPTEYGALKVNIDFTDYMLYLDDKVVGKDITKLTKLDPGDHRLMLEKEQFEEYRTQVSVKPRRTTELTVSLRDLKPKTTQQQRAKTRFADGKSALDGGRYPEAIQAFDDALAEQPEYAEARQYRGWACRKLGNTEEAIKDMLDAAQLYALSNRYLEAVTCANLLIDMRPGNGEFLLLRGEYHTALGEQKSAVGDYETAVNCDAKSLKFRLALAEGYYRAGQFKEAAREFEKARKMADDPVDIYVRLILSYMYAGKDKDLVKRYSELAGIAPSEKMERLRTDPEWQRVLQLVGPDEKLKKP